MAPKVYDELEEITGVERATLHKYKSVAENTAQVREDVGHVSNLDFSHYREVAPLEPELKEHLHYVMKIYVTIIISRWPNQHHHDVMTI